MSTTSEDHGAAAQAEASTGGIGSFFSGIFRRREDVNNNEGGNSSNTTDIGEERRPFLDDGGNGSGGPVGYGTTDEGSAGALLPGVHPPERPGTPTPWLDSQVQEGNGGDQAQQQQEQPANAEVDRPEQPPLVDPEDVENEEEAVQSLTQRLRCLFTALTLPIIPIGTALSFLLLFVLYAAFVTDLHRECSAPLHGYAIVSLALFLYAPNHRNVKLFLFNYSRERDGPVRPRPVRMYDQLFQTLCLLYVYGGMTLIQTCQDDMTTLPIDGGGDGSRGDDGNKEGESAGKAAAVAVAGAVGLGKEQASAAESETSVATTISTCAATCPALYASTKTFVTTLEIFAIVLILPLLCLPCIYIWVVRRASAVAALAELGRGRGGTGDDDYYTAREILNGMDSVRFVYADDSSSAQGLAGRNSKVKVVTLASGAPLNRRSSGTGDTTSMLHVESQINLPPARMPSYRDREDVRECCICMTEFRVAESDLPEDLAQLARNGAVMSAVEDPDSIVRTKCGHFFHRSCLGGWLGGQWTGEDNGTNRNMESRGARRRACPLCREDLAPGDSSTNSTSAPDRATILDSGIV